MAKTWGWIGVCAFLIVGCSSSSGTPTNQTAESECNAMSGSVQYAETADGGANSYCCFGQTLPDSGTCMVCTTALCFEQAH